jgi:hypothetical protein
VVTSQLPRAFETAIAMGFAVDEQQQLLSRMGEDVDAEVDWTLGFPEWSRALARGGAAARFAREQAALLRQIAGALPAGGRALVVSHGGIVEAGAVGCLPDADHAAWGGACGYCEGVRLAFDGDQCVGIEVLRVPGARLY